MPPPRLYSKPSIFLPGHLRQRTKRRKGAFYRKCDMTHTLVDLHDDQLTEDEVLEVILAKFT